MIVRVIVTVMMPMVIYSEDPHVDEALVILMMNFIVTDVVIMMNVMVMPAVVVNVWR